MSFSMSIPEQAQVAAAEGVAGSTQHVEHVTSVGPWALRRDSTSSWTAISSPGSRTRRGTISSAIASATMGASSNNPFSDAFAASLNENNPFRDRNTSGASSSTAVASPTDAPAKEKSEFTRTMELVDRQAEEVRHMVEGEPNAANGEELERTTCEAAVTREVSRSRSPESPSGERAPAPVQQQSQPPARVVRFVEREAAVALRLETGTMECYTCKQHAQVATVGMWLLGVTVLLIIASMIVFLTMDGRFDTKLFQGLLGVPFAALWSAMSIAGLMLLAMKSPTQRRCGGGQFFLWWLCSVGFAVFIFYLVVGIVFKFGRS
ncbi:hypothetical protein H2200_002539 [Cladophialophora chaetospira]|uniref:Transmembrane protein n=1 Tax=Cladophialophora chaetospira TaxID=386627 RepID=A0AA38XJV8_9EURO|nr:hypothetical protein H2200_002539 [Cladophialophora chaetospira]